MNDTPPAQNGSVRRWAKPVLGEVARIERATVIPGAISKTDLYVGLENITSGGDFEGVEYAEQAELKSNKFRFGEQHVLYGKLRPYLAKIAAPDFPGICSTDILPIRPGPHLDRRYLLRYLRTSSMIGQASSNAVGVNLPRLSPRVLESFEIPLPPIEEQRRIAALLDLADEVRLKRRQTLAELDRLSQAIFVEMFGDPVSNPKGWPMVLLAELGDLDRGVSKHRPRNDPSLLGGVWPLIQTGDVANSGGYVTDFTATYSDTGLAQSKLWPVGTLCITIAANIAKTGILTFDACFPDSVVGFTAHISGGEEFVRAFLKFLQPILERQAPESAQKNINLKVLRNLAVPRPPSSLIAEFARAVGGLNSTVALAHSHEESLDMLFDSLQQRAFQGEL